MKYQKPINSVQNSDQFSSGLMEAYGKWMGGDCFQNTEPVDLFLSEAFDGMTPQSHGAEIENTTTKKKTAKKESPKQQLATTEEYEVLEREEYEIDGEVYVIEKVKMNGEDDNGFKTCWKGYKKQGTKVKGGKEVNNCVKAGFEPEEGEDLQEKAVSKAQQRFMGMVHATKKGEKAPSKEVAKVASSMSGKEAEKFASTKHKDLPEKKKMKEGMDPAGKEDGDVDNDGDKDKSDKYLHARRKKINKIMSMKKK